MFRPTQRNAAILLLLTAAALLTCLPSAAAAAGNDWMAAIDDATPLWKLSIPGSHDACALFEPLASTAKCQNLKLGDQLNIGVRFLDIRCCKKGSRFWIYHGGVDQRISFSEVIATIKNFLRLNPKETVIMSVKEENSQSGDAFHTLFDSYVAENPGVFYLGSAVPTLGTVRGKIVLLRRFNGTGGIDASDWPDNTIFARGAIDVEDYYNVPNARAKWDAVVKHLDAAASSDSSKLFITFTSGFVTRQFGIPNIAAVSNSVNRSLSQYFSAARPGRYGIVIINYVDAPICAQIIAANAVGAAHAGGAAH